LPCLHDFLAVEPLAPCNPRDFLRGCGRCERALTVGVHEGQDWLVCPRHRHPVAGCGQFNPLRAIDGEGVLDGSWKTAPGIDRMMSEVRKLLGNTIVNYFWRSN
jgi:hypothetical protein